MVGCSRLGSRSWGEVAVEHTHRVEEPEDAVAHVAVRAENRANRVWGGLHLSVVGSAGVGRVNHNSKVGVDIGDPDVLSGTKSKLVGEVKPQFEMPDK